MGKKSNLKLARFVYFYTGDDKGGKSKESARVGSAIVGRAKVGQ